MFDASVKDLKETIAAQIGEAHEAPTTDFVSTNCKTTQSARLQREVKLVPSAHELKAPTPATNGVQQLVDAKKQGNIAPAPPAAGAPAAGAAATAMATASLVATTAVKQPAVSEEKKAQVEVKKPEEQKKE